jgi:two-component system CheB/CheR fusion protein
MAQEEASAKFAGMPSSAIATGLVDYVLPVEQMPRALLNFVQGPYLKGAVAPAPTVALTPDLLRQIYMLLRNRTKHDFSMYKTSTVRRRIERRMNVHQIQVAEHYTRFLQEHPYEIDLLFQELLIGVTNFFRDPEAFEFLASTAISELLEAHPEYHPIRVWVPGCSTGEEAYSLAIVLRECLEQRNKDFSVQMFATDLNGQAIERARTGLYPEGIAVDVSAQRLERYFLREDSGYRIKKEIREMGMKIALQRRYTRNAEQDDSVVVWDQKGILLCMSLPDKELQALRRTPSLVPMPHELSAFTVDPVAHNNESGGFPPAGKRSVEVTSQIASQITSALHVVRRCLTV